MTKEREAKTNAVRALERHGVHFQTLGYDPTIVSAQGVAQALSVPPAQVFKTLVMRGADGRALLVMVGGDTEVDPRALARSLGIKSVEMVTKSEAERLTGLQTGGIGALALVEKRFDVVLDQSALRFDEILVNGGRRGLNLKVPTDALIRLTRAKVVEIRRAQP